MASSRLTVVIQTSVMIVLVMLAIFAVRATAIGTQAPTSRPNTWTTPHVLTISDGGDITTLNPHLSQFATVANLSEMTMPWLVRWDEHNQPYPELAIAVPSQKNGGISADGKTITYHLRHGVRWSDGAPFNADDVVFSTKVVNNPANNEGGRFDQLARVDEPDKYTVVFHLKAPYSPAIITFFSSCCANPSILPKHLLAKYKTINNVPYNALPVGIGPFKFERWDRSTQVVLVADPLYWRGRPKLDRIIYKIVPSAKALLAQVRTHRVDMWYQFGGAYLAQLKAIPQYTIFRHPSYAYNHLDFNIMHPVVADPVVRQALRLALNRRQLVATVEHGVGIVQDSVTPVNAPYYIDAGTTPYDPAKANAMLDAAGWLRANDGIRMKNNVRLNLDVALRTGSPDSDDQFALVQKDWQKIGVALTIHHYPATLFLAAPQQGGIVFGNGWDVTMFAYAADPIGDFLGSYGCDQFPPAGGNDVRWCNPNAQRSMLALEHHYALAQRRADLRVTMHAFIDDAPSIVTYVREDLFAYNRDLKNYHPNNVTPFDNMMDVDI